MNVVLAAPRPKPRLMGTNINYLLDHDREHMYLTLTAAFRAAATFACDVLVVSDFGCNNMGHPAQEVASVMYKVAMNFAKTSRQSSWPFLQSAKGRTLAQTTKNFIECSTNRKRG